MSDRQIKIDVPPRGTEARKKWIASFRKIYKPVGLKGWLLYWFFPLSMYEAILAGYMLSEITEDNPRS